MFLAVFIVCQDYDTSGGDLLRNFWRKSAVEAGTDIFLQFAK
jgi:hypothetical protein